MNGRLSCLAIQKSKDFNATYTFDPTFLLQKKIGASLVVLYTCHALNLYFSITFPWQSYFKVSVSLHITIMLNLSAPYIDTAGDQQYVYSLLPKFTGRLHLPVSLIVRSSHQMTKFS